MITIRIDQESPVPAFEQLREQIAAAITTGALPTGTKLSPVRQLARDLSLAPGTVMRAYKELEAGGLIHTRRGGGTTVKAVPLAEPDLQERTRTFVTDMRSLGASDDRIRAEIALALQQTHQ